MKEGWADALVLVLLTSIPTELGFLSLTAEILKI